MDQVARDKIKEILEDCVNRTITRVVKNVTFKPFHESLLTKEIITASTFERSFSTSFGQGPIEAISQIVAIANGSECERQKITMANVNKGAEDEIDRIFSSLRAGDTIPNWNKELTRILAFSKGDYVVRRVIADLWIKKDGIETFISIKTVKPNLDQTEIAKKDLFRLKAHDSSYETFFGLYYNPGGPERTDYNWKIPSKIFDMINDPCVLIGKDYWNKIGGDGTYSDLLKVFEKVGNSTRKKLRNL